MKKAVFGLAKNEDHARRLVNRLQEQGFDSEFISFLVYDAEHRYTRTNSRGEIETNPEYFTRESTATQRTTRKNTMGVEKQTKAPEGAATGGLAGGIIGGSLGLLAGLGALAIPGVGPFIAAGPLLAALSGAGVGGGVGLLIGALVGLGLPKYIAEKYQDSLKAGRVLVGVDAQDYQQIDTIKDIMKKEGAEDISTVTEKATSRG